MHVTLRLELVPSGTLRVLPETRMDRLWLDDNELAFTDWFVTVMHKGIRVNNSADMYELAVSLHSALSERYPMCQFTVLVNTSQR
jgi:hypothetical protein